MAGATDTTALAEQQAELSGLLANLDEHDWQRPSPCEGWTVADVVLHMVQTNALAIASARDEFPSAAGEMASGARSEMTVDDAAALAVERERGEPGAVLRARWQEGADELLEVLGTSDPSKRVTWVAGQLSVRTLTTTRLAETWIHANDVADALGVQLTPAPRLKDVARLAWRTLPYAFARPAVSCTGRSPFSSAVPTERRGPSRPTTSQSPRSAATASNSASSRLVG